MDSLDSLAAECEVAIKKKKRKKSNGVVGRPATPGMESRRAQRAKWREYADLLLLLAEDEGAARRKAYSGTGTGHTAEQSARFDELRRELDHLSTGGGFKQARPAEDDRKQPIEILGALAPCPSHPNGQSCADFAAFRSAYLHGYSVPVEGGDMGSMEAVDPHPPVRCYDSLASYIRVRLNRDTKGFQGWFSDANSIGETIVPDQVFAQEGEYTSARSSSRGIPAPQFCPEANPGDYSRVTPYIGVHPCSLPSLIRPRANDSFYRSRFAEEFHEVFSRSPAVIAGICKRGKKIVTSARETETRKVFAIREGGERILAKCENTLSCCPAEYPVWVPILPPSRYFWVGGSAYRATNKHYVTAKSVTQSLSLDVARAVRMLHYSGYPDDAIRSAFTK